MTDINENQMSLDMTLEAERSIMENVKTAVRFTEQKLMTANPTPSRVRNRHEAFGIAAENQSKVSGALKKIKGDMDTLLGTLGDVNRPALEAVSSICNDSLDAAVAVIIMTAEMQRTLSDLYEAENLEPQYPMDDLIGADESGFEEAAPLPEETENENEYEMEDN